MIERACPHCGAGLPVAVDAFCPACRNDLSEPPTPRAPRIAPPAGATPAGTRKLIVWCGFAGATVGLVAGVGALAATGSDGDGGYVVGYVAGRVLMGGLVGLVIGVVRAAPACREKLN